MSKKSKTSYHGFVSEIDQFLQMLDKLPEARSSSKIAEEQQYRRIFALRDNVQTNPSPDLIWKEF